MNKDVLFISLKAKLETLFEYYKDQLEIPEQVDILKEGFVFSRIDPSAEILVMGINPSLRNDFVGNDGYSYDYKKLNSDRYFKKFDNLLNDFQSYGITYCDLFYQRHTEQKQINHFLKDDLGRAFLREQIQITKSLIERVSPKLILLFNRQAGQFFSPEWLGYELEENILVNDFCKFPVDNLYSIRDRQTLLYLSAFLGYRTSKKTYENLYNNLPIILKILKKYH